MCSNPRYCTPPNWFSVATWRTATVKSYKRGALNSQGGCVLLTAANCDTTPTAYELQTHALALLSPLPCTFHYLVSLACGGGAAVCKSMCLTPDACEFTSDAFTHSPCG
eukprot:994803-Pyramimonas_sp.AAC.1